jgi:hypothetical protein
MSIVAGAPAEQRNLTEVQFSSFFGHAHGQTERRAYNSDTKKFRS